MKTKGMALLRRIMDESIKLKKMEDIEKTRLSPTSRKILHGVIEENSKQRLPTYKNLTEKLEHPNTYANKKIFELEKQGLVGSVTIAELQLFYRYPLPKSIQYALNNDASSTRVRRKLSGACNPRAHYYLRFFIALIEINGRPVYREIFKP